VPDTQAVGGSSRALSEGTLARHISSTTPDTDEAVRTSNNALKCGHGRESCVGSTSCPVAAKLARSQHVDVAERRMLRVHESAARERDLSFVVAYSGATASASAIKTDVTCRTLSNFYVFHIVQI
jgi:hypothetical protein